MQLQAFVVGLFLVLTKTTTNGFASVTLRSRNLSGTNGNTVNVKPDWALEDDWALLDLVPKYTVGDDTQARTFWAQLQCDVSDGDTSPRLSLESEEELLARYRSLSKEKETEVKCTAGPSPPILQSWSIEGSRVTGALDSGRVVWFTCHLVGLLEGDPSASSPDLTESRNDGMLLPGGFVEAVGGRVYELGQPRQASPRVAATNDEMPQVPSTGKETNAYKEALTTILVPQFPWVSSITATVSALVASTMLAAWLGFGAGITATTPASTPPGALTLTPSSQRSSTALIYRSGSGGEQAVSELRARKEARVYQERRVLTNIQDRLQKDEISLQRLQQLERDQQDTALKADINPAATTTTEAQ